VLSGSIFSYWHFPVCKEHGAYQENETSDGICPLLFPAGKRKGRRKKNLFNFSTLTEIRSSLSLQGADCNSILMQGTLQSATLKTVKFTSATITHLKVVA